jgi:hypothetical protein
MALPAELAGDDSAFAVCVGAEVARVLLASGVGDADLPQLELVLINSTKAKYLSAIGEILAYRSARREATLYWITRKIVKENLTR